MKVLVWLLVLVVLASQSEGLTLRPDNETSVWLGSPLLKRLSPRATPSFPLSGLIVYVADEHPSGNFTDKIVLYQKHDLKPENAGVDALKAAGGCRALILQLTSQTKYSGYGDATVNSWYHPTQDFPVFEVTLSQTTTILEYLQNQNGTLFVTIEDDPNPWHNVFSIGVPILSLILLVSIGLCLLLAVYKFVLILQKEGLGMSIGQGVLSLNIQACIFRVAWLASNPFGVYGTTSAIWTQVGLTLPLALTLSGSLMITLYWRGLVIQAHKARSKAKNKMLVIFMILSSLVIAFDIAAGILRGAGFMKQQVILLECSIYAVIVISLLAFFIATKNKLLMVFEEINKQLNHSKEDKLKLANKFIIGIISALVVLIVCLFVFAASDSLWIPVPFIVTFSIFMVTENVLIWAQVVLIRAPPRPWWWLCGGLCVDNPHEFLSTYTSTQSSKHKDPSHHSSSHGAIV